MRILIVDDSSIMRKTVARSLRQANFKVDQVLEADNGQEALEILELTSRIDLILSDWNMPIMDGLAFVRAVRRGAIPDMKNIPIIMITAGGDTNQVNKAVTAGANGYIRKPFTPDILRTTLMEFTGEKKADGDTKAKQTSSRSNLLDELSREHAIIIQMLNKIDELDRVPPARTAMLLSFKHKLLEHLKKEDEKVYPALREEAKSDTTLQKTLNKLRNDTADLKYFIRNFFQKYEKNCQKDDFQADFDFIKSAVINRITLEKEILFKNHGSLIK